MEKTVEVTNVTKSFNGQSIVKGISFDKVQGEIFGLIGPNGTGKTTPEECGLYRRLAVMEMSVRIFRKSLLMYGKEPTIKELIKYVRQN